MASNYVRCSEFSFVQSRNIGCRRLRQPGLDLLAQHVEELVARLVLLELAANL
jgi:hypothetical protein